MVKRPKLNIEETSTLYTVSLENRVLFQISKKDRLSLKVAIVAMVNTGLAKQVELAKCFHLRRETIANYVKAYKKSGLAGLPDRRTGPDGISDEIEKRVVELLSTSMKKTDIVKTISQEFGKTISRTKVYNIRKQYLSVIQKRQSQESNEKKK